MDYKIDGALIERFLPVTEEERRILDGRDTIEREIYMQGGVDVVNAKKLLSAGKLITVRPHTRFIHFPCHTHDYVEMVYMCAGSTEHIVNGKRIKLSAGELLFLSENATHEIERAGEGDVALNFIILPDFFASSLSVLDDKETPLRRFIVDSLTRSGEGPGYLHFRVSEVKPIQNLVENLLHTLLYDTQSKRTVSQMTMTLIFLQLLSYTETLSSESDEEAILKVLRYIETDYVNGSLGAIAREFHYDMSWLSREIKRKTGKNYTELVKEKRLAQAAFLLRSTDKKVSEISFAVGYENLSYFHRSFAAAYGVSPKHYRDAREDTFLQK